MKVVIALPSEVVFDRSRAAVFDAFPGFIPWPVS
jgi:hypothetical protein